jgi:hypothetical protein
MTTGLRVKPNHFQGAGRVHSAAADGLAAAVRGLAQDHARIKIEAAALSDLTDSTTGATTSLGTAATLALLTAAFDATSAGGAQATSANTIIGTAEDAMASLADAINNIGARIGLPNLLISVGTVATRGTIPAVTKAVTTANGASSSNFASMVAALTVARNNLQTLKAATDAVSTAVGDTTITGTYSPLGNYQLWDIKDVPTVAADATGATSYSKASMDTFMTAVADGLACMIAKINIMLFQAGLTDLTDSTGGTAANSIATLGTITPATQSGSNLSPKAGFDTEIAVWRDNFADLASRLNALRDRYGLTRLTDSSAGSANTTLASMSVNLTAVDGTAANGLDATTALTAWNALKNNVATVVAAINDLADRYGVIPITYAGGGAADRIDPIVVVAMATTGGGVSGGTTNGVLDTEVDANLVVLRGAMATMARKLNEMTGTEAAAKSLKVVAS